MTLQEKYQKINRVKRSAILQKVAFKLNYAATYFRDMKFYKNNLTDSEVKLLHRVFDLQLEFQEVEKKHYDNLCN